MLGLTATPYRGQDAEETDRLVRRYGTNRLDSDAFSCDEPEGVIRELQDMGVLAQVDHETIEGETFSLDAILGDSLDSDDYEAELHKMAGSTVASSRSGKIASLRVLREPNVLSKHTRNRLLRTGPLLFFATSVKHAHTVAALLNRKGIRSRAVSGETEALTRRRVVEEFRRGENQRTGQL